MAVKEIEYKPKTDILWILRRRRRRRHRFYARDVNEVFMSNCLITVSTHILLASKTDAASAVVLFFLFAISI